MATKIVIDDLKDLSFIVFYGSQLGQAESIAEGLVDTASDYDFVTRAFPLNTINDAAFLAKVSCPVVIIASTTGDGEPPENADKFWRKIRKKGLKSDCLASVRYTVLGLGDTNYNQFCHCGKEIHNRLQQLGGTTFYPPGWADDAVGLELIVDDWLQDLWTALEGLLRPDTVGMNSKAKESGGLTLPSCPPTSLNIEYRDKDKTFPVNLLDPIQLYPLIDSIPMKALISKAKCLSKPGAVKTTLELTVEFQPDKLEFEPGDAIAIVCHNPPDEVHALFERLGVLKQADVPMTLSVKEHSKGKIPAYVPPGCTIRQTFLHYCDIRTPPKKVLFRLLAEYTSEESEKKQLLELCSRQGSALFDAKIRSPGLSLMDILLQFPSCYPTIEVLIEHLSRLIPRAYSISSSPLDSKDSFTFAFNIITFSKEDGRKYSRTGVCTGWLYNLCKDLLGKESELNFEDDLAKQLESMSLIKPDTTASENCKEIVIYRRKNHNFRLPTDLSSPVIMVGPGTGVAPFVGFVEHRDRQKTMTQSVGDLFLYFGCRNKELDYLYEDKLTKFADEGTLTKLCTSFSRDENDEKIKYVQHNLELNKEEVVTTLFDKGGYFYVCGDAKNMAKNVRETLLQCVQSVKGSTEAEAKTLLMELTTGKRYLQDVWA